MTNIKITTILVLLLFSAKQGAFAQTALDSLQIEINNIAAERKKLQRQVSDIKKKQSDLQRVEYLINARLNSEVFRMSTEDVMLISRTVGLGREINSGRQEGARDGLQSRAGGGGLHALQDQEDEIRKQLETLQMREKKIKQQLEALQKQQAEQ